MATVVKKNTRSQDEIRKSLGLSSGSSGSSRTAENPTSGNIGVVRPTSGSGAAPAGWYGDSGGGVISAIKNKVNNAAKALKNNGVPSVSDYKGTGYTYGRFDPGDEFEYDTFVRPEFETSAETDEYRTKLKEIEASKPDAYKSKYEGAIQSILDGILSGNKNFDAASDANYNLLYNQMREQYMNAGRKAMQDAMGSMQAQSGGYGSTAAAAAGSQAFDNSLQQMNAQNPELLALAYQMFQDKNADRYNQLSAVQGVEDRDYSRYRDTVGDWKDDRGYYAGRYDSSYGKDWDKYQYDTTFDYNQFADDRALAYDEWKSDRDLAWNQYALDTNMGWNQYNLDTNLAWDKEQYEKNMEYQKGRDAVSDENDLFDRAYKMAASGITVPSSYSDMLDPETLASLNALAAQIQAQQAAAMAGGSGGGGGRGGRRSSSGSGSGVAAGAPFASGIGLVQNRNAAAVQVNKLIDSGANDAQIMNYLYQNNNLVNEQREEIAEAAGINVKKFIQNIQDDQDAISKGRIVVRKKS